VRLNRNLAATSGPWRGWGLQDGRFWVEEPVPAGAWKLDVSDDLRRWSTILETNVHSGLFRFSEGFTHRIPGRYMRLIGTDAP
jgi:hypothetical protein